MQSAIERFRTAKTGRTAIVLNCARIVRRVLLNRCDRNSDMWGNKDKHEGKNFGRRDRIRTCGPCLLTPKSLTMPPPKWLQCCFGLKLGRRKARLLWRNLLQVSV